ncbi:DNA ligase LigA-related protein [Robertmurraya siralis]|uniref:DNA ligase LigA-related protein n=1 Tax=Robertmurraya siralis TaxID=77777 RepID=UPI0010F58CD0|nr:hypothetical protein [Robertmurraya siralis]
MNKIEELIHRRRRQILIHSYLYYEMNTNLIDDHTYDLWTKQLAELQKQHPNESKNIDFYYDIFVDFDGSTGFHLPKEAWMHDVCLRLINEHKRRTINQ